MHEAKISGEENAVIRASERFRRKFTYSDDLADACVFLVNLPDEQIQLLVGADCDGGPPSVVNIGMGTDVTIAELADHGNYFTLTECL